MCSFLPISIDVRHLLRCYCVVALLATSGIGETGTQSGPGHWSQKKANESAKLINGFLLRSHLPLEKVA
jgi:hypothetical protein